MIGQNNMVVSVKDLSKSYYLWEMDNDTLRQKTFNIFKRNKRREIKALQNISFDVFKGESFGIIGRNGSGKSTLLSVIQGGIRPSAGEVSTKGKMVKLKLGLGFDPELTAKENIYVNGSFLGISFKRIGEIYHEIIGYSELDEFQHTRLKFFSTGMAARLSFAIALHLDVDTLLMDEFFGGVGDENFRIKSERSFREDILKDKTVILVSHNLDMIRDQCHRVLLLDHGKQVGIGKPDEMMDLYKKMYT